MKSSKKPQRARRDARNHPTAPDWARFFPLALAAAGLVAYANSFSVPFIFDDSTAIEDNENIRSLWPISRALTGPDQSSVAGRPIINFSFALNYAFGALNPRGYHIVNLAIHVFAAMALCGIVRRTLRTARLRAVWERSADGVAMAASALWLVHPIQTESVTYVVQRAESMMGLFYLLTLYCFIRGATAEAASAGKGWFAASAAACAIGMGCKEVMATAPFIVLLYDRVFLARSWRELAGRRWPIHAALWGTIAILAALVAGGPRSGSAGFGLEVTPLDYARAQFGIIVHYLRLCAIPYPLILDYGWPPIKTWGPAVPWMAIVLALLAATAWALWRRPAIGYAGACFFIILAPSSTIVPIADLAFEHRMYLPLAALASLAAVGGAAALRRWSPDEARRRGAGAAVVCAAAAVFVLLTLLRNHDYRSSEAIWTDVTIKRPSNSRGHNNLGIIRQEAGRHEEARALFEKAIALKPDYWDSHFNLGNAWADLGDPERAILRYEEALRLYPEYWKALNNLAAVLADLRRFEPAERHARRAVQINPNYADAHNTLGTILAQTGRLPEAIQEFEAAIRLNPRYEEAKRNRERAIEESRQATAPPGASAR